MQVAIIPNLFPLEPVQKCQHCHICVLREIQNKLKLRFNGRLISKKLQM